MYEIDFIKLISQFAPTSDLLFPFKFPCRIWMFYQNQYTRSQDKRGTDEMTTISIKIYLKIGSNSKKQKFDLIALKYLN